MYYVESMVNLSSLFLKCIIFNLTTQQNSCRTNSNLIWSVFIWCSQWSMPFIIWQNFYQVYNYICLISNLVLSVIVCVELIMFGTRYVLWGQQTRDISAKNKNCGRALHFSVNQHPNRWQNQPLENLMKNKNFILF